MTVTGCFDPANVFNVYLSNSTGSFATRTLIGSYTGFFATAGTGYKIEVESTSPVVTSAPSAAFTISTTTGPVAQADPVDPNRILLPQVAYGWCKSITPQTNFFLKDNSTGATAVTGTLKDDIAGTVSSAAFTAVNGTTTLNPSTSYYTFVEKATSSGGIISTKAYYIINTNNKISLSTNGDQSGCIPQTLTYQIGTDVVSGIGNNFPGTEYLVDWGDGNTQLVRQCDLMTNSGNISHSYADVSCSQPNVTYNITITLVNPWKVITGTQTQQNCEEPQVLSHAKIFKTPLAQFVFNPQKIGCINTGITFQNLSQPGAAQFGTTCTNFATYYWYVNGVPQLVQGDSTPVNFTYTFAAVGKYEVKLVVDNGSCDLATFVDSICIEPKPVPAFKMNGKDSVIACAPFTITTTNQSNLGNCQNMKMKWTVTDTLGNLISAASGIYTITSGNDSSTTPSFKFNAINTPGYYKIQLSLSNICGPINISKYVSVIGGTTVTMPAAKTYCDTSTINFATNTNHIPVYSSAAGNEVYAWTVTPPAGGSATFVGGTSAASKYPQIKFTGYGAYT
ncbi:hypothetical protein F5148DRAFT_1317556, partial [Russula earlei]